MYFKLILFFFSFLSLSQVVLADSATLNDGATTNSQQNIDNDDELEAYIRNSSETFYPPVGTCKMGFDDMAVVDDKLKVHGIDGLRVVDASIMPTLIGGNTNAPTIMIGDKASDMILNDWK